jgi:enoyl-CoA hydratase
LQVRQSTKPSARNQHDTDGGHRGRDQKPHNVNATYAESPSTGIAYDRHMSEVEYEARGSVARITINRPDRRNSLSFDVLHRMSDLLDKVGADESIRVVILTGAGDRAFCAGADLGDMSNKADSVGAHEARGLLAQIFRKLWALDQPTIARVHGYALAGGFGLALSCDFVLASDDAQFGTPEVAVGLWPFMITVPLLRSMPPRFALELMMTGRRVAADEALRVGIVNRVVPPEELDQVVDDFASDLSTKSPLILKLGKRSFYRSMQMDPDSALEYLQAMLTLTMGSADAAEGLAAFVEKRKPLWSGK